MLPLNAYPQINTTAQIVITEQIKHIVVTSSEIAYLAIPDTDKSFPKYIIYILKKRKHKQLAILLIYRGQEIECKLWHTFVTSFRLKAKIFMNVNTYIG